MIYYSRYKQFSVYRPIRVEVRSGSFTNSYEYVTTVSGTIRSASTMIQLVAQGDQQQVTNTARLYNAEQSHIGFGHRDIEDGRIDEIGPDWVIVNDRTGTQYKIVNSLPDDEHESSWISVNLLAVKDLVTK